MSDKEFKKLARELAGKQRHSSSILLLVVITLISVVFVWAAVSEIGVSEDRQNSLRSAKSIGTVLRAWSNKKEYVSEGDFVEEGELLFDIDPIDAKTQLDQAQKDILRYRLNSYDCKQKSMASYHSFLSQYWKMPRLRFNRASFVPCAFRRPEH